MCVCIFEECCVHCEILITVSVCVGLSGFVEETTGCSVLLVFLGPIFRSLSTNFVCQVIDCGMCVVVCLLIGFNIFINLGGHLSDYVSGVHSNDFSAVRFGEVGKIFRRGELASEGIVGRYF